MSGRPPKFDLESKLKEDIVERSKTIDLEERIPEEENEYLGKASLVAGGLFYIIYGDRIKELNEYWKKRQGDLQEADIPNMYLILTKGYELNPDSNNYLHSTRADNEREKLKKTNFDKSITYKSLKAFTTLDQYVYKPAQYVGDILGTIL